jgi:excisionase family DNA binding protein
VVGDAVIAGGLVMVEVKGGGGVKGEVGCRHFHRPVGYGRWLRCSVRTIFRWVKKGVMEREEGKGRHMRRYRFRGEIREYLEGVGAMDGGGNFQRELMRAGEAAKILGVSKGSIYRWFTEGRFGGLVFENGRRPMVRIFRDEFERYIRGALNETVVRIEKRKKEERRGRRVFETEEVAINAASFCDRFGPE